MPVAVKNAKSPSISSAEKQFSATLGTPGASSRIPAGFSVQRSDYFLQRKQQQVLCA